MNNKAYFLWEDSDLIAINKPSGLRSLPDGYQPELPHLRTQLEPIFGRLWIVHRLDKDTSGVILLARSVRAHKDLNSQFQNRAVTKIYHAIVGGSPPWEQLDCHLPLKPDGDRHHRTVVDRAEGKPATTRLHVLERFRDHSLIETLPITGRRHQIRAHLSALGFPVLSDPLYANREDPGIPIEVRMGLHAWSLQVHHPTTREILVIQAPYPQDFYVMLKWLREKQLT